LSPSDGVLLNHSHVKISSPGSNTNVMANGMYDFILAYYNPEADYDSAADPQAAMRARLPSWPSGLTVDGRYVPGSELDITDPASSSVAIPARVVNGVTFASRDRKAPGEGGGYGQIKSEVRK
jgi:hypothetical protein